MKETFDRFGILVDVFMPKGKRESSTKIAFFRYIFEKELRRAIDYIDGMIIDGKCLYVKVTNNPKKEWRKK